MSTSSSRGGRNKRRSRKVGRYWKIRETQLIEERTAIPKALSAQVYLGGGKRVGEEDPAIANIVLQSVVRTEGQQVQVVVGDKNQLVGAMINSAGTKIKAVQVRTYWRRALNAGSSQVSNRKVRSLRSRLEQLVPDIVARVSGFESLLDCLRFGLDAPTSQAIDAVLEIQTTAIPEDDLEETIQLLVSFVKKHRGTNSQKLLITVGAAIRKVLLNLPAVDLGLAVDLMKSEGSLTVPIGVELEVAKMVVQRVIEDPSLNCLQFPQLADALYCNAKQYSTPNMVNREFYNATALNSVLACLLMRHPEGQSLSTQILKDSPSWFSKLCSNRLNRICTELRSENDLNNRDLMQHLASLPLLAGEQKIRKGTGS